MVNRKHGKNMPSVVTMAPAKALPRDPSTYAPWKPTNVAKITRGAGKILPMAIPSRKTLWGSHAPIRTASTCMNGMAVYAPPNESVPATRPSTKRVGKVGVLAIPRASDTGEGTPRKTT